MSNGKGGGGFVAGLLIGVLVGGAAAVLLAQEDMRDMLVGKAREAGNFAMDATGDLRGKVGDLRGKVDDLTGKVGEATSQWQTSAADLYARGKDIVDNARSNFSGAVDEGRSTAQQMRDDLGTRTDA
ncbi:MAG TPA: YtxH domain-containing protein [Candidatus Baltobacteraceae bacterium]|jgi:gas vesicle protein